MHIVRQRFACCQAAILADAVPTGEYVDAHHRSLPFGTRSKKIMHPATGSRTTSTDVESVSQLSDATHVKFGW